MIAKELRSRAEDAMRATRRDVAALAKQDVQRLVHELQVHQIELEMQNDTLQHAQTDLEASQAQYRELFDCAPAGYLMLDANGTVARANMAASTLLGVSHAELMGQRLIAFVADQDVPLLRKHLGDALENAKGSCQVRLRGPADVARHVRMDTTRVPSPAADCLVVLTDVTERQHSLEALKQLNVELEARVASRTAELAARNIQLEAQLHAIARIEGQRRDLENRLREADRLESLTLLAGGLAHDFNNLLVSVLGNAELLLLQPELPDEWREALSQIRRAGSKASEFTRQLLVFAGRGMLSTCAVSLPHMVAESLEQVRARLPRAVQLRTQITMDVPWIEADRGQIQQAVMNLVTNAIEATGDQGVIVIATRTEQLDADGLAQFQHRIGAEPGPFAILRVQDSGPGIDPLTLTRIFDPFFTTKFTGRGLGLSTVLGVVQGHRGALRVQSNPCGGTSFEVALPATVAPRDRDSERVRTLRDSEWTGSGTVLLIDDDDDVRTVVARMLGILGFDVTSANGGERGLSLFQDSDTGFDLVVLDWLMPGFSGEQVLRALRDLDPELPVVLISGYSAEELVPEDERLVRVQKPMALGRLRDAVRTVLGDEQAIASSARARN
jgi:PAS domain S-box-containing protein